MLGNRSSRPLPFWGKSTCCQAKVRLAPCDAGDMGQPAPGHEGFVLCIHTKAFCRKCLKIQQTVEDERELLILELRQLQAQVNKLEGR